MKKENEWQKVTWAKKVEICEQGRDSEEHLLHSYMLIFIALEAIFFAAVFSLKSGWAGTYVIIGFIGIGLALLWMHVSELRGNAIDRWLEILSYLWKKVDVSEVDDTERGVLELAVHYEGGLKRRERREKGGRIAIFLGWDWWGSYSGSEKRGHGRFGWFFRFFLRKGRFRPLMSARWVLITFLPVVVIIGWVYTIVTAFDC